jgi:cysteine desulfurase
LEDQIVEIAPDAIVMGAAAPRLPNTTAIAMPGVAAETQVIALDLDGVMVSSGAACSSGKVGPSHVLTAMRISPEITKSTIRVSLGWNSSAADIAHFLHAWTALYRRHRGLTAGARAA